jgi:hypothetical protein
MMATDRQATSSHPTAKPGVVRLSSSGAPKRAAAYPQPRSVKPALWHLRMPSRSRFVPVQHRVMPSSDRTTARIRAWAAKTNQRLDSHAKAPRLGLSRALPTLLRALQWSSRSLSWKTSATGSICDGKACDERSISAYTCIIRANGYKTYLEYCQQETVKRISGQLFFTSSCANKQGREECSRC